MESVIETFEKNWQFVRGLMLFQPAVGLASMPDYALPSTGPDRFLSG